MKIISFAWTTPALLAGEKTVTRRRWNDDYARGFRAGETVQAYDRSPRFGGQRVAFIELTEDPYLEWTGDIPLEDYEREGFMYLHRNGIQKGEVDVDDIWRAWIENPVQVWVVRFRLVSNEHGIPVTEAPTDQLTLFGDG